MREIKFRAWDKKEKCWVGAFAIHQSGMFSDWAGCKKVNGVCVADANWTDLTDESEVVVMRFTGLLDKNGVEIYEGDIDGSDEPMYVAFENGSFGLKFKNLPDYFDACVNWDQTEIVGNIHENPDLLR